jgi:hypothetical protein
MRIRSRQSGLTILQTLVGAALLVVLLAGANAMVSASNNVAQTTNDLGSASNRADRTLAALSDALRRGSLDSVRLLNDTPFIDGASDQGFRVRQVQVFRGSAILASPVEYRFDLPGGATEGSIVRTQDGIQRVLASGVTSFDVSRSGNLFRLDIRTRSGPGDDRGRAVHAALEVAARNP